MTARSRTWLLRCTSILLAAGLGCEPVQDPTEPSATFDVVNLVDAVHNQGLAGFYFLPPLAPQPTFTGTFDPSLSPGVQICELAGTVCGVDIVIFSPSAITVDPKNELYAVSWRTQSYPVDMDHTYRIRVLLDGRELGYADVDLGKGTPTIPILFRIEEELTPVPVAHFTFACSELACSFDASGSTAQPTATYSWSWGDGTSAGSGATATHTYDASGSYSVQLTVTDAGGSGAETQEVTVTAPVGSQIRIAFGTDRDMNAEIYGMNEDGTGAVNLTNHSAFDEGAAWSPDGTKILFLSTRDGDQEIYVMNADGSEATNLSNDPGFDGQYAWSPDGTRIAFVSTRHGNFEIYVMNSDGSGLDTLTDNPAMESSPAWSPDGSKIAFVSRRESNQEDVFVMNADGTGVTRLTTSSGPDQSPAWSPDGTRIAWVSRATTTAPPEIFVMNADGTGQTNLTQNAAFDAGFAWSPDGTKIAFVSRRDGGRDQVYVMNADGTGQTNVSASLSFDVSPAWSGDGTKIAFVSSRDGNDEIYVVRLDTPTPELTRLTNNEAFESKPAWRP